MSVQGNNIFYGHFTSDGNPTTIEFPGPVNFYYQMNWTQWNSTANPAVLKRAWFHSTMPDASYLGVQNTAGAATDQSIRGITGGFTPIDYRTPPTFAATAVVSVTQANPAVVTANNHGLVAGDIVVFTGVVGMEQLSSIVFEVTNVIGVNSFNIGLDTTGFSAAGAGGTVQKLFDSQFYRPQRRFITAITQANPCVITHSIHLPNDITVGEVFRIQVPAVYGMTEIDGLQAEVTAINAATNQITVNIDSTGFTAFAYPVNPALLPFTPAQMLPIGDDTSTLSGAVRSRAFSGLQLGSAVVGASADDIKWVASTRELLSVYH